MGLIGRYLDSLPDEARDRVIEAQGWVIKSPAELAGRCLLGHAEDWGIEPQVPHDKAVYWMRIRKYDNYGEYIGFKFDHLSLRFTLPRIVRAIKARAARPNRITLPAPEPEAVQS